MKSVKFIVCALCAIALIEGCKKDDEVDNTPLEPMLVLKFKFDSTQQRLGSNGQPEAVPGGHGAQSPRFNTMSSHYIELAQNELTAIGTGAVLFKNAETTAGGSTAINFSQSTRVGNNETFFSVPLSQVTAGTYEYLRVSLAYQNYDVNFRVNYLGTNYDLSGTLASFIGYNTYVGEYKIKDSIVDVYSNKLQGYWGFETHTAGAVAGTVSTGQAPPGATTVPNPVFATSPIPQGSCLVTGAFSQPFVITGSETEDVVITVSLSTNKSFEWTENSTAGYFEPLAGDTVVDMGIRGLIPIVQ